MGIIGVNLPLCSDTTISQKFNFPKDLISWALSNELRIFAAHIILPTGTNLLVFDDPYELPSWAVIRPDFAQPHATVLYTTQYNVVCKTNVCWPSEYSVLIDFLLLKSTVCLRCFSVGMHQSATLDWYRCYWSDTGQTQFGCHSNRWLHVTSHKNNFSLSEVHRL